MVAAPLHRAELPKGAEPPPPAGPAPRRTPPKRCAQEFATLVPREASTGSTPPRPAASSGRTAPLRPPRPSRRPKPPGRGSASRSRRSPSGGTSSRPWREETAALVRRGFAWASPGGPDAAAPTNGRRRVAQLPPPRSSRPRRSPTARATSPASPPSPGPRPTPTAASPSNGRRCRADPHPTFAALTAFAAAHPSWPGDGYLRYREEAELLVRSGRPPPRSLAFFAAGPPQSSAGKLALRPRARRVRQGGRGDPDRPRRCGATAISTPGPRARSCATSGRS